MYFFIVCALSDIQSYKLNNKVKLYEVNTIIPS